MRTRSRRRAAPGRAADDDPGPGRGAGAAPGPHLPRPHRARASPQAGIRFSDWSSLDDDDREHLVEVFQREIYPVLTPLAVDPGHPFPYISNLSLNLVVEVQDPSSGEGRIARVKVPADAAPLRGHARRRALRPARAGHRGPPRLAVPRHDHRAPPRLPGHPQRRPGPRGGRGGRPAGRHRDGAAPPPLRQGPAARGRGRHGPGPGGPAGHRARDRARRRLPGRRRRST